MASGYVNIRKSLESLGKKEVYTLLLFALYKLRDVPEYATLSELAYVLDGTNLPRFLKAFEGATIKVPTIRDFNLVLKGLLVYQSSDIDGNPLESSIKEVSSELPPSEVRKAYLAIRKAVDECSIQKREG